MIRSLSTGNVALRDGCAITRARAVASPERSIAGLKIYLLLERISTAASANLEELGIIGG
jgi:hypothetical protein